MEVSLEIVKRLQAALAFWGEDITQKRMFGGDCFLYKGKMCVGEIKEKLMVRVLADKMEAVMEMTGVHPMDFTGKPMREFIYVIPTAFDTEEKLQFFVELGIAHAQSKLEN